jgi:hypothetical protein
MGIRPNSDTTKPLDMRSTHPTGWPDPVIQRQFQQLYHDIPLQLWIEEYLTLQNTSCLQHTAPTSTNITQLSTITIDLSPAEQKSHPSNNICALLSMIFTTVLIICGIYCIAIGPYLGVNANPIRNLPDMRILIVNRDSEHSIGRQFDALLRNLTQNSKSSIPFFSYISATIANDVIDHNQQYYEDMVLQSPWEQDNLWAMITVASNVTTLIHSTFTNGCTTMYSPKDILSFAWDEARNPSVAQTYIRSFIVQEILQPFMMKIANEVISNLSSTKLQQCIENGHAQLCIRPIDYTEHNLTPTVISSVGLAGITVGNIWIAIFSASIATFYINFYFTPVYLEDKQHPWERIGLRMGTIGLIAFGIAMSTATYSKSSLNLCELVQIVLMYSFFFLFIINSCSIVRSRLR